MREVPSLASRCVSCGRCEARCPQGIRVREELKHVKRRLDNPLLKAAIAVERLLHR